MRAASFGQDSAKEMKISEILRDKFLHALACPLSMMEKERGDIDVSQ